MLRYEIRLSSKQHAEEDEGMDALELFAAVKLMRKADAESLKRRIDEASSASPASVRANEEAVMKNGDANESFSSVKVGCFLRTRIPFKKYADYATVPLSAGAKIRNVVITRQKSQLSKQLANVVAAKKARFFGHSSSSETSSTNGKASTPEAASPRSRAEEHNVQRVTKSIYTSNSTLKVASERQRDHDEQHDDYTVPWCGAPVETKRHVRRDDAEATPDAQVDANSNADSKCLHRRRLAASKSKGILRNAIRRKEDANEPRRNSAGRSRPRGMLTFSSSRATQPGPRASWFGTTFSERSRVSRHIARSYFSTYLAPNANANVQASSAVASSSIAISNNVTTTAVSEFSSGGATCSLLFGSSSAQIAKQQRGPSAVPTILQRARTGPSVLNASKLRAAPRTITPVTRSDARLDLATDADHSLTSVRVRPDAPPPQPPQSATELMKLRANASLLVNNASPNRPLTASELFKMRQNSQSRPDPATNRPSSDVCVANGNSVLSEQCKPANGVSLGAKVPQPAAAVNGGTPLSPSRKPSTVLELLRNRQAQSKLVGSATSLTVSQSQSSVKLLASANSNVNATSSVGET